MPISMHGRSAPNGPIIRPTDAVPIAMLTNAAEQHARDLVARFAMGLRVKTPRVRFVKTSSGPCYEALFNCIEIDEQTLALPESLLCLVIAHEVGHATQRGTMLLDFVWTGLGAALLLSVPCYMFATSSEGDVWRISAPGLGFALAWFGAWKALRLRATKRAAALELDADAKAAQLCGVACAMNALEVMAQRVHIEPARFDAMRARVAGCIHPTSI